MDIGVDEQSLARGAHLARVVEAGVHRALDGCIDIGIGEHDDRTVTAELEQVGAKRGLRSDALAGCGGAGEEQPVDIVMVDDRGTDLAHAMHDIEDARRQAGLGADLGDHVAADGGELRRLPDGGIAGGDDVGECDRGDVGGEVVGGDDADDAERTMREDEPLVVRLLLGGRKREPPVPQDLLAGLLPRRGRVLVHLLASLCHRLADLDDEDLRDLLGTCREEGVDLAHDLHPLDEGRCGPAGLRGTGGLDCA